MFLVFFLDSNWSQSWVPFQRIIGSTFQNSPHHCVAVLQRGMYSISAWFWSKTLGDLPVDVIGPLIGSSLIFAMTGVGKTAESQPCSRWWRARGRLKDTKQWIWPSILTWAMVDDGDEREDNVVWVLVTIWLTPSSDHDPDDIFPAASALGTFSLWCGPVT